MNHILSAGLAVQLQAWDSAAVSAVYGSGPACTPPSIIVQPAGSAITIGNGAQLSVTASGAVLSRISGSPERADAANAERSRR